MIAASSNAIVRRTRWPIAVGAVASLAMHAFVIVPAMITVMTSSIDARFVRASFQPDSIRPAEDDPQAEHERNEITLGLQRGSPSTLTWIGHEQYEQHLAQLAQVEQAAFTDEPAAAASDALTPALAAGGDSATQANATTDSAQQAEHMRALLAAAIERIASGFQEADASPTSSPGSAATISADEIELLPVVNSEALVSIIESDAEHQDQQRSAQRQDSTGDSAAAQTVPRPLAPEGGAAAPGGATTAGEAADKDAAPTSTIEVPIDQIKLGKPLAARGLEVKPQRPHFSILQRLSGAANNPLAEIHFARDGKPVVPTRLIEGTGNSSLDEAIVASLFRWRAAGNELEALEGEQTVTLHIRILLHAVRR